MRPFIGLHDLLDEIDWVGWKAALVSIDKAVIRKLLGHPAHLL